MNNINIPFDVPLMDFDEPGDEPDIMGNGHDHHRQDFPPRQSSADFVAGFVPPDYLAQGLLQRLSLPQT